MMMVAVSCGCSWEWCTGIGVVKPDTELNEEGGAKESAVIVDGGDGQELCLIWFVGMMSMELVSVLNELIGDNTGALEWLEMNGELG